MKNKIFVLSVRLAALIFALALMLLPTVSCASVDEAAFLASARELITRSAALNEIYFGSGIEYDKSLGGSGIYYYASEEYLAEAGFSTLDGLRAMTAEVFSEEYCEIIYQSAFEGVKSDNSIVYARYSLDKAVSNNGTTVGEAKILVNSSYQAYEGLLAYDREYDLDSLEITDVTRRTVTAKLLVTYSLRDGYTDDGGLCGTREREITFIRLDDGGFRINTPTY